mmetsp:Transcript_35410/g.65056  ORF Transcript_35410/g.65056 Transcript_35410/m.65056 type:complete len:248 (-) Transcript_35410:302-1045(-)
MLSILWILETEKNRLSAIIMILGTVLCLDGLQSLILFLVHYVSSDIVHHSDFSKIELKTTVFTVHECDPNMLYFHSAVQLSLLFPLHSVRREDEVAKGHDERGEVPAGPRTDLRRIRRVRRIGHDESLVQIVGKVGRNFQVDRIYPPVRPAGHLERVVLASEVEAVPSRELRGSDGAESGSLRAAIGTDRGVYIPLPSNEGHEWLCPVLDVFRAIVVDGAAAAVLRKQRRIRQRSQLHVASVIFHGP